MKTNSVPFEKGKDIMLIYIVMHYQPSNFWKPLDFVIQQSIFTVKITVM